MNLKSAIREFVTEEIVRLLRDPETGKIFFRVALFLCAIAAFFAGPVPVPDKTGG